jgi:hypothetical protein
MREMTWLNEGGASPRMLRFFPAAAAPSRAVLENATIRDGRGPAAMDHRLVLRADCSRCQALCCVSLAFDQGESFAFDKPANVACPQLKQDFDCRIHRELTARGQAGCAAYDCYGAGQRVTQELFGGRSWRKEPPLQSEMFEAFLRLKRVHELRLLLHEAGRLRLSGSRQTERKLLLTRLEPPDGFSCESLAALPLTALEASAHAWLRGLSKELSFEHARRSLPVLPP